MPREKLSQRFVDSLPQSEKLILYFDTALTGFGVYTTKSAKTYFVQARVGKKLIKITIGKASVFKLDEARVKAKLKLALMADGVNPVELERKEEVLGMTLQKAMDGYFEARTLKPRTVTTYKDLFRLYLGDWLEKPIGAITKEAITQRHSKVGEDHGEAAANNLMRSFRAIYNYTRSITDNGIPENPVQRLSQTRQWYKIDRRRTFLKPHELKYWYDAAVKIENQVIRDYLLLTIFTGLRKNEGLLLKWENVDMKDRSFIITDTKNGRPHTLPISNFLDNLFKGLLAIKSNEYVFPGGGEAGHLIEPKKQIQFIEKETLYSLNGVATKAEFDKKLADNPNDQFDPGIKFCLHDLRRTFITIAESLDIPYAALKKLLNHADGSDVTGGYLQITTDRLREPMQKISSKLMELMGIQLKVDEEK
jgi:integrase